MFKAELNIKSKLIDANELISILNKVIVIGEAEIKKIDD
jgi:hypothetical protein